MRVSEKNTKNFEWLGQQADRELNLATFFYLFPAQNPSATGGAYYSEYFIQRIF